MAVYYNENDSFTARWLRDLISAGLLPTGHVDERSVVDVQPSDLDGFAQCHFFAGIGGWAYALRLAGWPDDRPVWTGSCPCQPFSSAGQRKGHADERHLWPAFYNLISECRPATIFGEQVASGDGPEWVAGIRADLEAIRYGVGVANLCAAGAAAPHIRQRFYWLADADRYGTGRGTGANSGTSSSSERAGGESWVSNDSNRAGKDGGQGLGNGNGNGLESGLRESQAARARSAPWAASQFIACPDGLRRVPTEPALFPLADGIPNRVGIVRGSGNAIVPQVAAKFIQAYLEIAMTQRDGRGR